MLADARVPAQTSEATPNSHGLDSLAIVLHMSDLHISAHDLRPNRERNEDLAIFTDVMLPRLGVHAVVLTGDLVDAKDLEGKGQQFEWEWKFYANVTARMKETVGPQCKARSHQMVCRIAPPPTAAHQ